MKRKEKTCKRCGYKWLSDKDPKSCAKCRSPYWNKKRVRDLKPAKYQGD